MIHWIQLVLGQTLSLFRVDAIWMSLFAIADRRRDYGIHLVLIDH
jgi:hypothetical protein